MYVLNIQTARAEGGSSNHHFTLMKFMKSRFCSGNMTLHSDFSSINFLIWDDNGARKLFTAWRATKEDSDGSLCC